MPLNSVVNPDPDPAIFIISAPSLKYPERQDIFNVPYCDILSTVSATTMTGRTYIVEVAEQKNATNAIQKKI